MKKITVVSAITLSLLLIFALTSCNTAPSAECAQMEAANKQLATNLKMYEHTWDEVINKGKLEEINETNFDSQITLISKPENVVGIEAFRDYYKNYINGFSEVTFTIIDIFGHGDKIVKHWNFKGKHTGEFFGIPATNREVDVDGVTLVLMKDGKIKQEQDFMDNLAFMSQLGLLPEQ